MQSVKLMKKKKNKGIGSKWGEAEKTVMDNFSEDTKEICQLNEKENLREISDEACLSAMLHSNSKDENSVFFNVGISCKSSGVEVETDDDNGDDDDDEDDYGDGSHSDMSLDGDFKLQRFQLKTSSDRKKEKGFYLQLPQEFAFPIMETSGRVDALSESGFPRNEFNISEDIHSANKKSRQSTNCYQPLSRYKRRRKKRSFFTSMNRKKNSSDSIVNDSQATTDSQLSSMSAPGPQIIDDSSTKPAAAMVKELQENQLGFKSSPQNVSPTSYTKTRKRTQKLSATAQIRKTRQGCVDLKTPNSILVNLNLKTLINKHTFALLPASCQEILFKLVPECDLTFTDDCMRLNGTALSNEFFTKACMEWRERLQDGEFTYENQSKKKHEESKDKLDPWKAKHFETSWGEKLTENVTTSDVDEMNNDVELGGEVSSILLAPPTPPSAVPPLTSTTSVTTPISSNLRSSTRLKSTSSFDPSKKKPDVVSAATSENVQPDTSAETKLLISKSLPLLAVASSSNFTPSSKPAISESGASQIINNMSLAQEFFGDNVRNPPVVLPDGENSPLHTSSILLSSSLQMDSDKSVTTLVDTSISFSVSPTTPNAPLLDTIPTSLATCQRLSVDSVSSVTSADGVTENCSNGLKTSQLTEISKCESTSKFQSGSTAMSPALLSNSKRSVASCETSNSSSDCKRFKTSPEMSSRLSSASPAANSPNRLLQTNISLSSHGLVLSKPCDTSPETSSCHQSILSAMFPSTSEVDTLFPVNQKSPAPISSHTSCATTPKKVSQLPFLGGVSPKPQTQTRTLAQIKAQNQAKRSAKNLMLCSRDGPSSATRTGISSNSSSNQNLLTNASFQNSAFSKDANASIHSPPPGFVSEKSREELQFSCSTNNFKSLKTSSEQNSNASSSLPKHKLKIVRVASPSGQVTYKVETCIEPPVLNEDRKTVQSKDSKCSEKQEESGTSVEVEKNSPEKVRLTSFSSSRQISGHHLANSVTKQGPTSTTQVTHLNMTSNFLNGVKQGTAIKENSPSTNFHNRSQYNQNVDMQKQRFLLGEVLSRNIQENSSDCTCNLKAMIICSRCGAFCHNECIGPSRICITCLIAT